MIQDKKWIQYKIVLLMKKMVTLFAIAEVALYSPLLSLLLNILAPERQYFCTMQTEMSTGSAFRFVANFIL